VDLELRVGQKEKTSAYFADPKLNKLLKWPVIRRENLDGIKLYLGDAGWVLVRASGTERMLRVYSEMTRPEHTQQVLNEVSSIARAM
jgi:phosphomannomutase